MNDLLSSNHQNIFTKVINPESNISLFEEKRLISVKEINGELFIKYNRDAISNENKKIIESQICDLFKEQFSSEKIVITTISEGNNKNVAAEKSEKVNDAQLKVGHGQVGPKKKIPNIKKVIAVGSGKGGVGKSTFAVNLAIALKNLGLKVGIIDADIYGPSIPMLLGARDAKPRVNEQKKMLPISAHGINFMSFGLFIAENDPVIWRGPMLGGVLNQFFFDVDWTDTEILILDLPPGTGDVQLSMVQNTEVDGAIIISTPQDVALLDAKKGLSMFRKVNVPVIGMVENMSSFICDGCNKEHFIFGNGGVKSSVKELETSFLGSIPLELELRTGSDLGLPYMTNDALKDRPVYKAYQEIAKNVSDFISNGKIEKKGFFSKLFT